MNKLLVLLQDFEEKKILLDQETEKLKNQALVVSSIKEELETVKEKIDSFLMEEGLDKVSMDRFSVFYRKGQKVNVLLEDLLPPQAYEIKEVVSLARVKELILQGDISKEVAQIETTQNLTIKIAK